ncbi:coiled-coil domain-containing protein 162 isoform X2 [Narcine bancroftii]|uniref:coiled-coil domain-containing protein 162 isoform X2 n=1 Tax=Narcine bancroftii TaxID=1343680 RepID=UPI003831ECEE
MAARIRQTLEYAYCELCHTHRPKTADESIGLEKQVLNLAIEKWAAMETTESSYSLQVQRDLFSGVFIEDPLFVRDVGLSFIEAAEEGESRPEAERQAFVLRTFCRLMEIITLRHRLMETASDAALLSQLYKSTAVQMGFDEFHLYLRPVQLEFASHKEKADQSPPVFITTLLEDDSCIDRYSPSSLPLAIQEVDENHIGKFSFRTKESVLQLMARHGVDNLQVALACQIVQKNSLIVAMQPSLFGSVEKTAQSMDLKDRMLSYRSQDNLNSISHASMARESESQQFVLSLGTVRTLASRKQWFATRKRSPETFISIQLEKIVPRDQMLNEFLQKKSAAGLTMKNTLEVEKIKRELILSYCSKFNDRMSHWSLRGQIIAYYASLLGVLQDFPTASKTYFVLGQPQEKKGEHDFELGLISDPRKLHQRPRSLLSPDGRTFLNLWYIPHHSEVLIIFKTLEEKVCRRALYQTLEIVAALHDIISYLCCFAQLGSFPKVGSQKMQPLAADWGGFEGIGSELQEIQTQLDNLNNPRDPAAVAKFLVLKRDVIFLQFDAAVRHSIREVFLSNGNIEAFQAVTDGIYRALPAMSNSLISNLYGSLLPLPQPLDAWSYKAFALFPWRGFLAREGFLPGMISNLQSIEYGMQMCLCRLKDRELSIANGEILGVSLLMEDVVQGGNDAFQFIERVAGTCDESEAKAEEDSVMKENEDEKQSPFNKTISSSKVAEPISIYRVLKSFLILWKQLEVLKEEWGRMKLGVEHINSVTLYKQFCKLYRLEILYPALKPIACRLGKEDEYERIMMDNQPLLPLKGTSEMEIKTRQLHKILESMECYMIRELQKKISKQLTLVMSERVRGEAYLPTEFWKHSAMAENFSIARPQIVENFVQKLKEHSQENENEIIFCKEHLRDCIMSLACDVMGRERSNFETYSMFYENILRSEHQLLYQKEQEVKGMQESQAQSAPSDSQLADFSHQIIIEITALRAKINNLEEENTRLKREIRSEVRQEYDSLVRHLFVSCFAMKQKLDEYHINMNKVVCKLISEVRRNGVENMITLKRKTGSTKNDDILKGNLAWQDQLQTLREENSHLQKLVCKLKTLNCWRLTIKQEQFQRSCIALEQELVQIKKDYLSIKMLAEEEEVLLHQQLEALRKALSRSQSENGKIKKELEKEKQLLKEYRHRAAQEFKNQQQLESMKASTMEQLLDDMQEKEQRLNIQNNKLEKSSRIAQIQYNKINKEIKQVRCQLSHERSLKLDAFQRVDELQSQMHNFEAALSCSSVAGSITGTLKKLPALSQSASCFRNISPDTKTLTHFQNHSLTISRDHLQYCLTTDPKTINLSGTDSRGNGIQRPKTVPSRLHHKPVETSELEDSRHYNLILKLKDNRSIANYSQTDRLPRQSKNAM